MSFMMPNLPEPKPTPPQFQPEQQVPEMKQYTFRWNLFVGLPLVIIGVCIVVHHINPSVVEFRKVLRTCGIREPESLIHLICLGLVLTSSLLIIRLCHKSETD